MDRLFIYHLCKALEHAVCAGRTEQAKELALCLRRVQLNGWGVA